MAWALNTAATTGAGTISIPANSNEGSTATATGVGTGFTAGYVGVTIRIGNFAARIIAYTSATQVTLDRSPNAAITGQAWVWYPATTRAVQSGTDTDSTGLNGIVGVTRRTFGEYTEWNIPWFITISGTYTTKANEKLTCARWVNGSFTQTSNDAEIIVTGTWTHGETVTKNSVTIYKETMPITFSQLYDDAYGEAARVSVRISAGGRVNWLNSKIKASVQLWCLGYLYLRDFVLDRQNLTSANDSQFRIGEGSTVDVIGLKSIGGKLFVLPTTTNGITTINFSGYTPTHMSRGIGFTNSALNSYTISDGSVSVQTNGRFRLDNFDGVGNDRDYGTWRTGLVDFYNPKAGCGFSIGPHLPLNALNEGYARVYSNVQFTHKTAGGSALQNVVSYMADNATDGQSPYNLQRTYAVVSNASGISTAAPLIGFKYIAPNTADVNVNAVRRSVNQTDDIFTWYHGGYEILPFATANDMAGINTKAFSYSDALDTNVTLSRSAALARAADVTVTTPGGIVTVTVNQSMTLDDLNDITKGIKYQGTAAAFALPSVGGEYFTLSGDIATGHVNMNVVVPVGVSLTKGALRKQLKLPGTGRLTVNGSIDFPFEDVDGLRVTVTGLDPEAFGITWFLRHRPTGGSTWTNVSGTGDTALILLTAGTYDVQVRAPGYDWESALSLNTDESLSLNAALRYQVSANNTPQYTMIYDAVLEAIFAFDPVAEKVSVTNETGLIIQPGFAELYQATQRIQHIPSLVWTWTAPVTANATSQKILIPTGNPISMYLTDDSNATVKITCPVIHADTGQSADDRVRGNPAGYSIILGSPATAESAGLASQIISSLGGPNYDSELHSLALVKSVIDLIKTATDSVKTTVEAIPDAQEIATQVEVAIIDDDDGRAVLQAIADKIMAEEISSTIIAQSVRAELAPELANLDAPISGIEGITPEQAAQIDEVVANTRATFSEVAKLTN